MLLKPALAAFLFYTLAGPLKAQENAVAIDSFSQETEADGLPKGWKPLTFKKIKNHTRYSVENEGGNYYVKAVSSASASAILKEIHPNLKTHPVLNWRWKIESALNSADARKKEGDDYAARVYVAFKYDPKKASFWQKQKYGLAKKLYGKYPPHAAINYIWDNRLPVGAALDNAYTGQTKMMVLESGDEKAGRWLEERRNIYEDYKSLFGAEPPEVDFVAIMTDTDNTRENATAYFDDLRFLP
ncbi:MAG: DUF3047 domain-containing protein [Elusimicrobia bacterium]|nr:DUF3047 domain-containing protein [Elusimicrobiota bacterium]